MQDDVDDIESPYFDWENDRLFDEPTRRLIDRIANDPRFSKGPNSVEIVEELAPEKSEDEQESLRRAAEGVFYLTVFPVLEAQALQLVDEALAGPDWEAFLPTWMGEALADSGDSRASYTDPDLRVLAELTRRSSAASDAYHRGQEEACARVESEARQIVSELPRPTRDLLVLANRTADRESLLEPWIQGASQRRRFGTAYYAQRIVREEDEDSVWDRYSAAAKILAGQGWTKKAIAGGIGIGIGRIDRLLERTSGQDIADGDPLCDLVPDLRGRGEAWRDASLVRARKPRPFSRLSVDEKVALAEESTDPVLLDRLAKQNSGRISGAIVARYLRGDVGENILRTIVLTSPWMGREVIEAHHQRPLPQDIVIALAEDDARVLLDCDDATALAAKSLGRKDFEVVLAFRESDTDALERILAAGLASESFVQLVDLLIERLETNETIDSSSLLRTALLHVAEQTDDVRLAEVGSQRIFGALVRRYRRRGDVGEDILQTILATSLSTSKPWWRWAMIEAHHQRPMPKDIVIALAEDDARVLLDCDDATAHAVKSLGRKDFEVVLAFRESDTDALERILTAGLDSKSFFQLVDLLIKRPLTDEMIDSSSLLTALLRAAEQTDDVESAAELRLIACQSPEILSQYIDEAKTGGRTAMLPEDIVEVARGSYDPPGRNTGIAVEVSGSRTRKGVEAGARALWETADLTIEHSHARKVVAERGSDAVSLETAGNIYVATADAIRSFPKSRTKEYTYVHMRLTPASDIQFGDMAIRTPHELPALGYHREMRKHPADPDGPDVEAIVWPIPFQPAIYSLDIHSFDTGLSMSAGLIAVSGSKVAVVEDL